MKLITLAAVIVAAGIGLTACGGASGGASAGGAPGVRCSVTTRYWPAVVAPYPHPDEYELFTQVTINNNTSASVGTSLSVQIFDPQGQPTGQAQAMSLPTDASGNRVTIVAPGQQLTSPLTDSGVAAPASSNGSGYTCQATAG